MPLASHQLVDSALALIDNAIDQIGEDAVIAILQAKYDQYAAPLDVPFVPNALEPALVDVPIKQAIGYLVRAGHKAIHHDPPAPAAASAP